MINLSVDEIEETLAIIEDPLVRAKAGIRLFERGDYSNPDALARYAEDYINILTYGREEVSSKDLNDPSNHDYIYSNLERLPKEKAKELASAYVDKRIDDFKEQDPDKPVEFNKVKNIADKHDLSDHDYELYGLIDRISTPSGWGETEIPEERLDEVIKGMWEIVQKAYSYGDIKKTSKVFCDERFQKIYAGDEKAQQIAKSVFVQQLKEKNYETSQKLIDIYMLEELDDSIREAVIYSIDEGRFEKAGDIASQFEYTITQDDFSSGKSKIETEFREKASEGKMSDAINLRKKIKSLENYMENGLNVDDVPQVILPEGYKGKIILAEFREKMFLRSDVKRDGAMHEGIKKQFFKELDLYGFNVEYIDTKGGARAVFEDGKIIISGKSQSFGECDKEIAKELVSSLYTDREVIVKADKSR